MTPEAHTIYSLSLFFSLASLLLWSKRRHRISDCVREQATAAENVVVDQESR
ncbi:MAG TPA: hypothetical protein VGH38_34235 [Bryobacteraceae bacterium]|jgi:hypothetical protein